MLTINNIVGLIDIGNQTKVITSEGGYGSLIKFIFRNGIHFSKNIYYILPPLDLFLEYLNNDENISDKELILSCFKDLKSLKSFEEKKWDTTIDIITQIICDYGNKK